MGNDEINYVEVKDNIFKPEEDKILEGVYIESEPKKDENAANKYHIQRKDKEIILVFGTTVLDRLMSKVKIGHFVKIEFTGSKPSKIGSDLKLFKVYSAVPDALNENIDHLGV